MKYLLLIFSLYLIVACGTKPESETNNLISIDSVQKPINFIGQWLNEGQRENFVRDYVREYEFMNQHVKVNLKFPEEVYYNRADAESEPRFFSEQLSKTVSDWDIVRVNGDYEAIAKYMGDPDWPSKHLVDFSQFPEFEKNISPNVNVEEIKKRWHGILPGPLLEGQYYSLWTNKKVAEKIGIEVKQFGMTFTDFLSYIKAAYQYNQKNPDHKITIWHEAGDWGNAYLVAMQLYVSIINDKEAIFTNEISDKKLDAWYQTLVCLEQLSEYQPIDENWRDIVWNDSRQDLPNEKCLFFANGSWMYNIWAEENPDNVWNCVPVEYPGFNKAVIYPTIYISMWAVLKNSPNKEEAIKMLLNLNTPEMAEQWVRKTKCPSGIKGNFTEITFGSDQFENYFYYLQENYSGNSYKTRPGSELILGSDLNDQNNYFMDVLTGEMSADEAMNQLKIDINYLQ